MLLTCKKILFPNVSDMSIRMSTIGSWKEESMVVHNALQEGELPKKLLLHI